MALEFETHNVYSFVRQRIIALNLSRLRVPARLWEVEEGNLHRDFLSWCEKERKTKIDRKTFHRCMAALFPHNPAWENTDPTRGIVGWYYSGMAYFPNGIKENDPMLKRINDALDGGLQDGLR